MASAHDVVQQDKDLAQQEFESAWNEGTLDETRYTEDFRFHGFDEDPVDFDTYAGTVAGFRSAFPDMEKIVEDCICEGDRVLIRYSATMTHEGELMGFDPSGEHVEASGMVLYRIEDGQIAEGWINYDALGIMQQIGAFPGSGPK